MISLQNNGRKSALTRLMFMKMNEGNTVLPDLTNSATTDFASPKHAPAGESQRILTSWILCRQNFYIVLFLLLIEIIFLILGIFCLGATTLPALFMIAFASISIIVLSMEWWTKWFYREASPMQFTPHVYPSRVTQTNVLFEQQQSMLQPPGKSGDYLEVAPVVHVGSPFGESSKELYPNGGGFKGRVAGKRRYDQHFMCSYIILSIIYVVGFFCLLAALVWISYKLNALTNNSTQTSDVGPRNTTKAPKVTTKAPSKSAAGSAKSPSTTPEPDGNEKEKQDNKGKIHALNLILVFIVLHLILVILRCFVFFYQNRAFMYCILPDKCRDEEAGDKGKVPIVVNLQCNHSLPQIRDLYVN